MLSGEVWPPDPLRTGDVTSLRALHADGWNSESLSTEVPQSHALSLSHSPICFRGFLSLKVASVSAHLFIAHPAAHSDNMVRYKYK